MNDVRLLLSSLAKAGVREWVVATGARNLALVRELVNASGARIWHGFEERSCGFFALGRIQGGAGPVAVVTTSGTAAAELLPAVIEAHYQGLPLVVVTADRPQRFRGSGAPQAIEQAGLFEPYCGYSVDLADDGAMGWPLPTRIPWNQPSQVNVCLEEPSAPDGPDEAWDLPLCDGKGQVGPESGGEERMVEDFLRTDRPTLALVAGLNSDQEREAVASWLRRVQLPALWECTAGWGDPEYAPDPVRSPPPGRPGQEALLKQVSVGQVLRIGSVPSWRWWRDLEKRPEVGVLSISRSGHRGLGRTEGCRGLAVDLASLGAWGGECPARPSGIPAMAFASHLEDLADRFPRSEPALLAALNRVIEPQALVFIGNSLPIREWNLVSAGMPPRRCYAARGANGIDGQISHGLGVGGHGDEIWIVVGDLTALYDLSAPYWIAQLQRLRPGLRIRIVVVNNGGGRIFSRLPAFAGLSEEQRVVTENRHETQFEGWSRMWGLDHLVVTGAEGIHAGFPDALSGRVVVELRPDEEQTRLFQEALGARWS